MRCRFLHGALSVRDMETTLDFYRNVLGFPVLFRLNGEDGRPKTVYLAVGRDQYLELFYSRPPFGDGCRAAPEDLPYGYHHLTFFTARPEETAGRLARAGIPFRLDGDGFWFTDPEGNLLRIENGTQTGRKP